MSTIRHLNPNLRMDRQMRRETVKSIQRVIPKIPSVLGRLAAAATAAALEEIRRAPHMTGERKQELFDDILTKLMPQPEAA